MEVAQEAQPSPFANEPEELEIDDDEQELDDADELNDDDEELLDDSEQDTSEEFDEEDNDDESEFEDDEEQELDDDELSDEEIDELLDSLDEEDDAEQQPDTVPHAALHKERERRKELQQSLTVAGGELNDANELVEKYESSLDDIKKQLKDLDLLDVVNISEPKRLDPEVAKVRAEQKQQEQQDMVLRSVNDVRAEAADVIGEYPLINGESAEQAEIVVGLALANMAFGMEQEDAVHHAMDLLNGSLAVKRKAAVRQQKPVSRKTNKARVQKRRQRQSAPRVEKGNVSSFFNKMADDRFNQ